jgi:hypothetical protein
MKPIHSAIQVNRDINTVFDFITNIANIEATFDHISNVVPITEKQGAVNSKYRQTRCLHGQEWRETVEVVVYNRNTEYTLSTLIFGIKTLYTYKLEPHDSNTTNVQLTKETHGRGLLIVFLPLVQHVLTRPEHDGNHLIMLKNAIERS